MRNRILIALVFLGAVAAGPATISWVNDLRTDQSTSQPDPSLQHVDAFADLRATTPDDVVRASFFNRPGRSLREWPNQVLGSNEGQIALPQLQGDASTVLRTVVCSHDLVVAASVTAAKALLNKSETALFTNFTLKVDHWIRPPRPVDSLVLSQLGGKVLVGGQLYSVESSGALSVGLQGIYFGRTIPGTSSFSVSSRPIFVRDGTPIGLDGIIPRPEASQFQTFDGLVVALMDIAPNCQSR